MWEIRNAIKKSKKKKKKKPKHRRNKKLFMFVILTIYKARNYIPWERKSIFLWIFEFVIRNHVYNSQSYKCTDWIVLGKIFIPFIMINIYIHLKKNSGIKFNEEQIYDFVPLDSAIFLGSFLVPHHSKVLIFLRKMFTVNFAVFQGI